MNNKEATMKKESPEQPGCNHYWKIATVAGRISLGICKICGEEKEFGNYITDCIDLDKENYLEWGGRSGRTKKQPDPLEEVFSELKGGSKNAVEAVA